MKMHEISLEGLLRRLHHVPKTIECGLHSGIPECCVRFYAFEWMFFVEGSIQKRKHRQLMRNAPNEANYIRCPACCRSGRIVRRLRPCPNDSRCWHSEEQAT